jgi:hypothetical protein
MFILLVPQVSPSCAQSGKLFVYPSAAFRLESLE